MAKCIEIEVVDTVKHIDKSNLPKPLEEFEIEILGKKVKVFFYKKNDVDVGNPHIIYVCSSDEKIDMTLNLAIYYNKRAVNSFRKHIFCIYLRYLSVKYGDDDFKRAIVFHSQIQKDFYKNLTLLTYKIINFLKKEQKKIGYCLYNKQLNDIITKAYGPRKSGILAKAIYWFNQCLEANSKSEVEQFITDLYKLPRAYIRSTFSLMTRSSSDLPLRILKNSMKNIPDIVKTCNYPVTIQAVPSYLTLPKKMEKRHFYVLETLPFYNNHANIKDLDFFCNKIITATNYFRKFNKQTPLKYYTKKDLTSLLDEINFKGNKKIKYESLNILSMTQQLLKEKYDYSS